MLGDEAHLARRRAGGIGDQHGLDQLLPRQIGLQLRARLVLADQAGKDAARAESGDVARDIAGAADIGLAALDGNDGRRRFRRNARHLAIDEFVEHEVADAEHGLTWDRLAQGFKIEHLSTWCPSAKAIGAIEKILHVGLDRVFQRGEAAIISGAQQPIDFALGEVLIAAADRSGMSIYWMFGVAPSAA